MANDEARDVNALASANKKRSGSSPLNRAREGPAVKKSRPTSSAASKKAVRDSLGSDPLKTDPSLLQPSESLSEHESAPFVELGMGTIPPEYDTGSYLGPSAGEDPYLVKSMPDADSNGVVRFVTDGLRSVAPEVVFTVYTRDCQCDAAYRKLLRSQWDSVEKVVSPFRDQLLALYFKFIDWTYPAVDKKRFYNSYYHQKPPMNRGLLAAMLALGCTYWKYNQQLCIKPIPPGLISSLWAVSLQYIDHDINCQGASLDVVQALLLYVQKRMASDGMHERIIERLHVGKLVSTAFTLGLHVDCSDWQISDTEKLTRRRVWALVYYVDKWSAANLGHPSLLQNLGSSDPKEFSSEFPQERRFVQLVKVTSILSEVLDEFYPPFGAQVVTAQTQRFVEATGQRLLQKLRLWKSDLPDDISDMRSRNSLGYCSNGMINLAALAVEVLIYRVLLKPPFMGRYRHDARGLVQRIILYTGEITHSHLHAFWISSCVLSLSALAHFVLLYHAQSPEAEQAQNSSLMRSWLDCLRVLNNAWEEGIGLTQHRMDALFHKGHTLLKVPIIDESTEKEFLMHSEARAVPHSWAGPQSERALAAERSFSAEPLGLEEDLLPMQVNDVNSPMGLLFSDNDLHDILSEYIWE